MTYFGMAFHLMTWDKVWISMKVTWFLPYIILYLSYFLIIIMKVFTPKHKKHHHKTKEEDKSEAKNVEMTDKKDN